VDEKSGSVVGQGRHRNIVEHFGMGGKSSFWKMFDFNWRSCQRSKAKLVGLSD
jgi:hypothetical protein